MRRALLAVPIVGMAACFDWNVASPTDAGSDAALDAAKDSPTDAPLDTGKDVVTDGPPTPDSATCDPLVADVTSKKAIAQACTNAGQVCPDPGFLDECGCPVGVDDPDAATTAKYGVSISNLFEAGCSFPVCSACPDGGSWMCNVGGDAGTCVYQ